MTASGVLAPDRHLAALRSWRTAAPVIGAAAAFLALFWAPLTTLGRDWWTDPDAAHGLLLVPVAGWLAWKRGRASDLRPQPLAGTCVLVAAVVLRYVSGLAAELFTQRLAMLAALAGLTVFVVGWRQLLHWWLPAGLLLFSIPLPDLVANALAFPLQLTASQWGATLLEMRQVPVQLAGNVLHLPGQSLFVTEACSGLRSLTALLALGLLTGGLFLRTPWARVLVVLVSIPVAMVLNAVRIFLTGFLVFFMDPALGEGVMHFTEGWAIFVVAFVILAGAAWGLHLLERRTTAAAAA